jgi:TRAP transporter TAXI family solute receptor
MKHRHLIVGIALCALSTALSAQQFVRIGSGVAGSYPVFGAKVAELFNKHVDGVKASTFAGPTEQSLVRLQRGEAEAVLTYTFEAESTLQGRGELKTPAPDIRHLMTTYGAVHMPVARTGVAITSLSELSTKPYRVWLGPKSSVFWPMNLAALSAYGVTPEAITKAGGVINSAGYQNLMQAFQDGQVDVAFFSGPIPLGLMMELDRGKGFRFLNFDQAAIRRYNEALPGTGSAKIPAGTYKSSPEEVTMPSTINQIVVSAKLPDAVVYQMAKVLNERYKELHGLFAGANEIDPKRALEHNRVPLHPGAERYYREVGLLK